LFDQALEEFENYLHNITGSKKTNAFSADVTIPYNELLAILKECVSRYPEVTSDNIISDEDLAVIFGDFPKLKTREDVQSFHSNLL
jgi:N-acetyl-anhydromuramyl-L-alanine amidase AmpD